MELNNDNLQKLGPFFQKKMGLTHWRVEFKLVDKKEVYYEMDGEGEDFLGLSYADFESLSAQILINKDGEHDKKGGWILTLLHELAHVLIKDFETWLLHETGNYEDQRFNDYGQTLYEQTVDRIAYAIYNTWTTIQVNDECSANNWVFSDTTNTSSKVVFPQDEKSDTEGEKLEDVAPHAQLKKRVRKT